MTTRVLIETYDRHGRPQARQFLAFDGDTASFTIGRSVLADVPVNDEHVAPLHASVSVDEAGTIKVSDLGSINGTVVDGQPLGRAVSAHANGKRLVVGTQEIRIRSSHEPLPAERPLRSITSRFLRPWLLATIGAVLTATLVGYETWLGASPRFTESFVYMLTYTTVALLLWISVWSLGTRIIRGQWQWFSHAAIVLLIGLLASAVNEAVSFGSFSLALPPWDMQQTGLFCVMLAALLYLHLGQATTMRRRPTALVSFTLPALIVAGFIWTGAQSELRNVSRTAEAGRIYPPQFRLAAATGLDGFFAKAGLLQVEADGKRKAAIADDPDGAAGGVGRMNYSTLVEVARSAG